ncbi:MAG: dihydrolipoyl dehydrogenase [Candidatus Limisoma sp.]|nr:dihydrolipoyl dehydrogenase [Muribaculaceae bacterium]
MQSTDLIIIGGGPGGYETALLAAQRGLAVTLIERGNLGGTCLNEGCIPTKTLCRSAALACDMKKAAELGVAVGDWSVDFPTIMARKNAVVEQLRTGVEALMRHPKISLVTGDARFVDALTVEVAGERYAARDVIIATGSTAATLPIEGADLPGVVTSKELLDLHELPQRLTVIGAGVIGLEFASIFHALGSNVTVLEYAREVLPHFDTDMAKRLRQSLGKRGIVIETQAAVKSVAKINSSLAVNYEKKGKTLAVEADVVLMAVGRKANVSSLNLDDVGIDYTQRGITVDDNMLTNVPHVYAIGDINGKMMLAHAATFQGVCALNHIMGESCRVRLDVMPAAVFTMPEAATVGLTEEDCKEQGIEYVAKKSFFRANGKALSIGEPEGYCKLLVAADHRLLGCHILGAHASDVVQEVCALITRGASCDDLALTIHAHPTLSEVVLSAARS